MKIYVNGVEQKTKVLLDELNQSFQNKEPFRIGAAGSKDTRFGGLMSDVRVYGRALEAQEVAILAVWLDKGSRSAGEAAEADS